MKTETVLLVDGDLLVFRCAAACQLEVEWSPGVWSYALDHDAVLDRVASKVAFWEKELEADRSIFAFTDPEANFRRDVLPDYKASRVGVKKPLGYLQCVQRVMDQYPHRILPTLEADDCLGIMQTNVKEGRRSIIVTADKDMRGVPGLYCDMLAHPLHAEEISELEADRFWMEQALIGDQVDNYKGCPGIGKVKARRALADAESLKEMWDTVVEQYGNAGLTEEDALVQARVARILRTDDYQNGEVILWDPTTLTSTASS